MNRYLLENFPEPSTLRLKNSDESEHTTTYQRDIFFQSLRGELGLGTEKCNHLFSSQTWGLYRSLEGGDTQLTDDKIHVLDFADIQTIGSVLDRQHEAGFRVVSFSAHLLSVRAMDRVLTLQRELTWGD